MSTGNYLLDQIIERGDDYGDLANATADDLRDALFKASSLLRPSPNIAAFVAAGMTEREAEVWEKVRHAAGSYLRLTRDDPNSHPMEREEICHAFHVIQGWLGSRPFRRSLGA
jgi:hypothetical protein